MRGSRVAAVLDGTWTGANLCSSPLASHAWLAASSQSMVDRWFSRGSSGAVEGASLSAAGVGGVGGGGQARCAKVSRSAGCTRQKASYAWSYVGARAAHGAYTRSGGGGATTDPEGLRRRIAAPIAAAPSAGACSGCAGTCTVRCSTSARICTGGAERVQLRCRAGVAQVQSGYSSGAERVLCGCSAGALRVLQRCSAAAVQWCSGAAGADLRQQQRARDTAD